MRVCVYGASSTELEQKYIDAVYELGKEMAARNMGLVFGGGAQGMMGAAARGVRDGGGSIIGVAPDFFDVDGVLSRLHGVYLYQNHAGTQTDFGGQFRRFYHHARRLRHAG